MTICAITCVKNEGPYLLEWLAHHRALGVDRFIVFSNDCEDGTDALLDEVAKQGWLTHLRQAPAGEQTIQWQALKAVTRHKDYKSADYAVFMDVDEFIVLDPSVADLPALIERGGADAMVLPWRLFGSNGAVDYQDRPVTERFTRAASSSFAAPLGYFFKTLYRREAFARPGVHRPKLRKGETAIWVDAACDGLPAAIADNDKRINCFGHWPAKPLVQLNHYSVRSASEFVVKSDRGLPNKMHLEIGLKYWVSRNWNTVEDTSAQRHAQATAAMRAEITTEVVQQLHRAAADWHQTRFAELIQAEEWLDLFWQISLAGGSEEPSPEMVRRYLRLLGQQ